MTRNEADKIDMLMAEFREFRIDDRNWKADIDERILSVEEFVTGKRAIARMDAARGVSRRAYLAAVIAAVGILVSIALNVVNMLV